MSKYTFEKLGSAKFEQLAQALLEKLCRTGGNLIQFGVGADGAREATWSQPSSHEDYVRPINESSDVDKHWVFQAKYHDIGQRGWDRARADVEADLKTELDKVINKYKLPCHKYILITNVPFSGVRHVGTRDKVNAVIEKWQAKVPEIEVWDATDLSRMLDADPDTRTTFLDEILPGDILRELLKNQTRSQEVRVNSFRTYLKSLLRSEGDARAEEAGDEGGLKLEKVFVDLDLALNQKSVNDFAMPLVQQVADRHEPVDDDETHVPESLDCVPASFALLRANYESLLIKGGPGVGKSTLTQFLSLYHAARLVEPSLAKRLAGRLKLRGGVTSDSLDSHCEVRFPLRIELRRYAKWVVEMQSKELNPHFASFFAETINKESSSSFEMEDIFALASQNPVLLLLDGLDEVPLPTTRKIIFKELQIFLDRCESENCDVNVILSSRPQGYRGEFDGFRPLEWRVVDLSRKDFDDYSEQWITERIRNPDERDDARQRVTDGMQSHAVQLMAKTLLQATVMLTIAKRKHAIPHAKHKLFQKFVDVIFEREQDKQPIIREKAEELKRLHEKVGFELICRMEEDGSQTLGGTEFKDCVERVIIDYGRGTSTSSISEVVNEIVVLAKDRLCLLAGKGEEQEDIDFVIQPFREYFAAAYLARHEDADPDRVYTALVARQHVWANVLQFYAAFQSPAQQRNWISEADGRDLAGGDAETAIEVIRRRRALLRVLPEFDRPKNQYIDRAYENLIVASPFVLYLLYEAQLLMALVMLVLSVGSALMRFKQGISWAIPTPYRRLVFEYAIGFRKNLWLIVLFYFVFGQSIAVQNFNLSMFCLISLSLLGMSFLMRNEHHYFIWIYTKSVRSFLLHKLKISLIAVSVLILPFVAIMLYTYTDQWFLILTAYLIGQWYQGFGILTKYSSYPRELSLVKAIVFIISLMCPPLMAILSIRYFRLAENKLIPLLS